MSELFQEIHQSLVNGKELVLATVVGHRGSTPRASGSSMIVYSDGSIYGTIGGGGRNQAGKGQKTRLLISGTARLSRYPA